MFKAICICINSPECVTLDPRQTWNWIHVCIYIVCTYACTYVYVYVHTYTCIFGYVHGGITASFRAAQLSDLYESNLDFGAKNRHGFVVVVSSTSSGCQALICFLVEDNALPWILSLLLLILLLLLLLLTLGLMISMVSYRRAAAVIIGDGQRSILLSFCLFSHTL